MIKETLVDDAVNRVAKEKFKGLQTSKSRAWLLVVAIRDEGEVGDGSAEHIHISNGGRYPKTQVHIFNLVLFQRWQAPHQENLRVIM